MICPVCKSDMIAVEHNKIEIDYCTSCDGIWFDSGELELLLESVNPEGSVQLLNTILNSPEARSSEKKRKCPICSRKMKKTTTEQEDGILIDVCTQGDGLWFDGGEVDHLIRLLADKSTEGPGDQQQIIGFIGDVFEARK